MIAVDAMGGDHGVSSVIPGLAIVLKLRPDVRFRVYGHRDRIEEALSGQPNLKSAVTVIHTDKKIESDEKPSAALRASKGTSMRMALEAVEAGEAMAAVSAGNTGALMALAKIVFKTLPGIHRPAIASVMPGIKGESIMLDLGANVLVDAETLVQFAVLGAVFAKKQKKIENPRVGLLNVGSEDIKGPEHIRAAAEILKKIEFPGIFHGFVEGDDIMKGTVDVIVADGYAGNVALKTAEGVGLLIKHYFKESFNSPLAWLGAMIAYSSWKKLKRRTDPRLYNGGVFLGLNGVCVKSHGGADALAFSQAVLLAVRLARYGYIREVIEDINHVSQQERFLTPEVED
ncbi:MAG: phosphate acyltransferase PlsX [Rhodospirillales bacterium]|nr:phosphate acyltransferase PlsX [Alphaproteobacteria bacterium]MCB1840442.1 phosphate acyltransferase PlsX [Alphaproteobacteria bacterium]MCB9976008.1 phosphate acyltransferase PlsX [Rhodospirillales bacterium]